MEAMSIDYPLKKFDRGKEKGIAFIWLLKFKFSNTVIFRHSRASETCHHYYVLKTEQVGEFHSLAVKKWSSLQIQREEKMALRKKSGKFWSWQKCPLAPDVWNVSRNVH